MNDCERKLAVELHAHIAEFKAFRELMNERDRRYTERAEADQRALAAALAAVKENTAASFQASKEAVAKTEQGQTAYNATHNDLTRKMENQYQTMLPRHEAEARFHSIIEKIAELREYRSTDVGKDKGMEKTWGWVAAVVMSIIALAGLYLR